MARKRDKQPITLLIVPPQPERAPVSLRFPRWTLPLFLILGLAFFLALGYFVDSRTNLERELAHYRHMVELESSRQREMRDTILAQQEETKLLASQVAEFQESLGEVDRLAEQVAQMMGLTTPTPTPTPEPASEVAPTDSQGAVGGQAAATPPPPTPAPAPRTLSSRGSRPAMGLVDANVTQIAALEASLPARVAYLNELIAEANKRLERIDPEKRTSKEQLERELRLLAAAPHGWPLDGKVQITSDFGYRVLEGVREFHEGIDLNAWYGTPVKATKDGVVTFAGWRGGLGWTVEIKHEEGFVTIYGHNSRLLVKKGAEVKAGDVIARSGSTGRSTGPHVHYEIRLNNKPVDPKKYIGLDGN
ncbi:MAG: M23 family metallopeptidase [Anaerolineae bacterium]